MASDAELVTGAMAGDRDALEALLRRHYRAAFAVALAVARHREDAEDICHDALIRAAERLADCRTPDRFLSWLCAIVRNHAHNVRTRGILRRATATLRHETAPSTSETARRAETMELRRRLESALGQLTPVQREVVLLRDLHGCSHEVIAGVVGTSPAMCRQHVLNARRRMRELLGDELFTEYSDE